MGFIFTRKKGKTAIVTAVNNSQRPLSLNFLNSAKAQIVSKNSKKFVLNPLSVEIYKTKTGNTLTVDA